ncbi:IclR family transcriptional regulator [Arthrobacter sp. NPDC056493]|uniref:IclR family transcriptional regulator n=1 Tax=Arthrobacter sp. NPDC056493 TaxID=3345839 RepID=UPI003671383D
MEHQEGQQSITSVVRAFRILETLARLGGEASLSRVATELDMPVPTAFRVMRTLVAAGYARQLPSKSYGLGPGLIRLGEDASQLLGSWARPALEALEQRLCETSNLAMLDGDMIVYVAQVPSRHQMRIFTEVGRRVYPHSTGVGKAILAALPDDRVLDIIRRTGLPAYTPTTVTTESALFEELALIRSRGYAVDEGEQEPGVRCFARAVERVRTPTAISVSGPAARVLPSDSARFVAALESAAAQLREVLT